MGLYVTLPREYEIQLQELADGDMRTYRQEAAYLLCRAIERALIERDQTRERHLEEVAYESD